MKEAVIVSAARTPIGKAYRGAFNDTHGAALGGHVIRHAVVDKPSLARLCDETGVFEQRQVSGDVRLRGAQNSSEFAHIEAVLGQDPEQPKPGWIAQQAEQRRRTIHRYL